MPLDSAERKPPLRGDAEIARRVLAALRRKSQSVALIARRAGVTVPQAAAALHDLWANHLAVQEISYGAAGWRLRKRSGLRPKGQAIRERLLRDLADGPKTTPQLCEKNRANDIHYMLRAMERRGLVVRYPQKKPDARRRAADIWKLAQPPSPARASDDVEVQPVSPNPNTQKATL